MKEAVDPRVKFLVRLGRALHEYGVPAHRLEDTLSNASACLGVKGEFFSGPTSLISSFGEAGQQHTALSRVQPNELQIDKLVVLDEAVEALYRAELTIEQASEKLETILASAPLYKAPAVVLAFSVISACACRFFGGGLIEMITASILGLITGMLAMLAKRSVTVGRVFEFLVAGIVTFLAFGAATMIKPLSSGEVILASLIILLPGLTITQALNELATGHLVSGNARLSGAMMSFLKLGLGVGFGRQIANFLPGSMQEVPPVELPVWTLWLALFITPLALTVLFSGRKWEIIWIMLGSFVAFWGSRLGVDYLDPVMGAGVGALLTGLVANLYARWKGHPAIVVIVPSIIMLVPGSIGYRSMSMLMEHDVTAGVGSAFEVLLIGVSLVAGLLLANIILPPRNAL